MSSFISFHAEEQKTLGAEYNFKLVVWIIEARTYEVTPYHVISCDIRWMYDIS